MTSLTTERAIVPEPTPMPPGLRRVAIGALSAGLVLAAVAALLDPARFYANWLVLALFVLTLGTGSLFFVAFEFVVNASWSVVFRRIAEHLAALVAVGLVALVPALVGMHHLWEWTNPAAVAASELLQRKTPYLNLPFFALRLVAYGALWLLFYRLLVGASFRQDQSRDAAVTRRAYRLSPVFMVVFGVTMTFAAIDLLMSLTPEWFSSLFGPYIGVKAMVAGVAVTTFAAASLKIHGLLPSRVGSAHFYGLGALLFALNTLAAYMAFAQFLLIWYGALPHETIWYAPREAGLWLAIFIVLVIAHFVVPFAALLSRPAKSNLRRLRWVSAWILVAHGLELYWIVLPSVPGLDGGPIWWPEIGFPLAALGAALLVWLRRTSRAALLPVGDPRLERALDYRGG
jgi:hypothetical protein